MTTNQNTTEVTAFPTWDAMVASMATGYVPTLKTSGKSRSKHAAAARELACQIEVAGYRVFRI